MKHWIFIPFALLIGLAIGGWGPKADLKLAQKELHTARRLLKKRQKRGKRGNLNNVTRMLGIEEETKQESASQAKKESIEDSDDGQVAVNESKPSEEGSDNSNESTEVEMVDEVDSDETEQTDEEAKAEMKEQIRKAVELWEVRSDIARATFVSNTGLNDKEATEFDDLVERMNFRIANAMEKFVEGVEKKEEQVTPEQGVRLANDVTAVIVSSYNEMDETMPETWREKNERSFQLMDFIDPEVALPLVDVQGKMSDL